MQITVIGTITNTTGYDIHTRQLANALNKIIPVRLSAPIPPQMNLILTDAEIEMLKRKPEKDEINLIITNPLHWKLNYGKRNWVYMVWEGDRIPKHFMNECQNPEIEKIIVPSKHTYLAIKNAFEEYDPDAWLSVGDEAHQNKIVVIPHGVDLNIFKPTEKPKKCIFLANKGFRNLEDRGGIQYLIKAYIEEFSAQDPVELIIKINPAYGIPNVEQMLKDPFFAQKPSHAPIHFDIGNYEYNKLAELYNKGTVFVSPTRAEAFNLPCLEAMACGLPVITTNFGGQTDYVNDKNGWLIGGEKTKIVHEIMYEGINWLTPSISELKSVLREVYSKPDSVLNKGMQAQKDAEKLSWDNTANKIKELTC